MNYYWNRNDEIEDSVDNINEIVETKPWEHEAEYADAKAAYDKASQTLRKLRAYDTGFYGSGNSPLHTDGQEFQRLLELKRTAKWLEKDDYIKYMRLEEKRLGVLPKMRKAEAEMSAATNIQIAVIRRYTGC